MNKIKFEEVTEDFIKQVYAFKDVEFAFYANSKNITLVFGQLDSLSLDDMKLLEEYLNLYVCKVSLAVLASDYGNHIFLEIKQKE